MFVETLLGEVKRGMVWPKFELSFRGWEGVRGSASIGFNWLLVQAKVAILPMKPSINISFMLPVLLKPLGKKHVNNTTI